MSKKSTIILFTWFVKDIFFRIGDRCMCFSNIIHVHIPSWTLYVTERWYTLIGYVTTWLVSLSIITGLTKEGVETMIVLSALSRIPHVLRASMESWFYFDWLRRGRWAKAELNIAVWSVCLLSGSYSVFVLLILSYELYSLLTLLILSYKIELSML